MENHTLSTYLRIKVIKINTYDANSKYPVVQPVKTQFLVPQIEYPLGGSSKKGTHAYFLLIVAMVLLL